MLSSTASAGVSTPWCTVGFSQSHRKGFNPANAILSAVLYSKSSSGLTTRAFASSLVNPYGTIDGLGELCWALYTIGVSVMDLRKITRWVGRLLLSAGLAAGTFLGTHGVAQAAGAELSGGAAVTTEVGAVATTAEPIWT